MNPQITIAIQCHNFQRRLCWMLSSLLEQTCQSIVSVRIDHEQDNGTPSTESVVSHFSSAGLHIVSKTWNKNSEFRFRGVVRNDQIKHCATKWMMFGDSDMVYKPDYFEKMLKLLESNHSTHPGLLSTGRMSNDKRQCTALVNEWVSGSDAMTVLKAFEKASSIPLHRKSNVGAGFSQIFSMRYGAHDGQYVDPTQNRDWDWEKRGSNPRSDIQFRKKMHKHGAPRIALPDEFTTGAIHLNHNRDPDTGTHTTEQR